MTAWNGDRLQSAIDAAGLGKTAFWKAMQKPLADAGLSGATRQSLYKYLSGERVPTVPWIREAAEVLGVEAAWLERGEGPRTKAEAQVLRVGTATAGASVSIEFPGPLQEGAPDLAAFGDAAIDAALAGVVGRLLAREGVTVAEDSLRDGAARVQDAIACGPAAVGLPLERDAVLRALAELHGRLGI
jgi:hypothetical protein